MEYPLALAKLADLKEDLGISGTSEDAQLERLIRIMSNHISSDCARALKFQSHTEYHGGDGTAVLYTDEYPIVSVTSLHEDLDYEYPAADLVAADDYEIYADEGKILRTDAVFTKHSGPSVKVVYKAGYSVFRIAAGINDKLNFKETLLLELTATIDAGTYNADSLATELKTQLDAAGGSTYTVTYDIDSHKFTLASDRTGGGNYFTILWNTGTNASTSIGSTIGFDTTADDADAASHVGDNVVIAVPDDLQDACIELCSHHYRMTERKGESVRSLSIGDGSVSYTKVEVPDVVQSILDNYRRVDL